MNFLAHLYLTPATPEGRIGALLGDFVKGPVEAAGYSKPVSDAIRLHRTIDTVTDAHPAVLRAKALFGSPYRRYAGILLDLYFDHCLARTWDQHHRLPLEQFAAEVYRQIADVELPLPSPLERMRTAMASQNWLVSYRSFEGLEHTLHRMGRRLADATPLTQGSGALRQHEVALADTFAELFPDLARTARHHVAFQTA